MAFTDHTSVAEILEKTYSPEFFGPFESERIFVERDGFLVLPPPPVLSSLGNVGLAATAMLAPLEWLRARKNSIRTT